MHYYGSREWYDTNWPKRQGLGESLTAHHGYYKGMRPEAVPDANVVGSVGCIEQGGKIANALPMSDLVNGFPRDCFRRTSNINQRWSRVSTYFSCSLQYFYARVMEFVYDADIDKIDAAFQMLIPGCTTDFQLGTIIYPDFAIVKSEGFCVVVIDGTVNFQQAAMQGFQGMDPPIQYGNYSTLPLWFDASSRVLDAMEDLGVDTSGRFMIVGHSYGAATAMNVCARLLFADPSRTVRFLCFGCPAPGDFRLARLINRARGYLMVNTTDLVGAIPPNREQYFALLTATGLEDINNWSRWEFPTSLVLQDGDGLLTLDAGPTLDYPTLATMLAQIILGQPFDVILAHFIRIYATRIRRRCPEGEWPISPQLWEWLLPRPIDLMLDGIMPPAAELVLGVNPPPAAELVLGVNPPPAAELVLEGPAAPPAAELVLEGPAAPPAAELVLEGPLKMPTKYDVSLPEAVTPPAAELVLEGPAAPPAAELLLEGGDNPPMPDAELLIQGDFEFSDSVVEMPEEALPADALLWLWPNESPLAGNATHGTATFDASASSWTAPAGVFMAFVECYGNGGDSGNPVGVGSCGAGGGAYAAKYQSVFPASTYDVNTNGNANANFSNGITDLVRAQSGDASTPSVPGVGGQASGGVGDVKFSGGDGGNRSVGGDTGGGGGGGAGPNGDGGDGGDGDPINPGTPGANGGGDAGDGGGPGVMPGNDFGGGASGGGLANISGAAGATHRVRVTW